MIENSLAQITIYTAIPFQCAGVDHDGETESRKALDEWHGALPGFIGEVSFSIPVNDYTVNAARINVGKGSCYLLRIRGAITNADVRGCAPPGQVVR